MFASETSYYVRRGIDLNYAALAFVVYSERDIGPDYALARVESGRRSRAGLAAQTAEMVRLREQGYSYKAISEIMGVDASNCHHRVKKWRGKHGTGI